MGDISEMRGLIVCGTFLGVFVLLLMWMPPELFTAGNYRQVVVEDVFEGVDVFAFADTDSWCLNETGGWEYPLDNTMYVRNVDDGDGYIGGHDVLFFYRDANETPLETWTHHLYGGFLITLVHDMNYYDTNGIDQGQQLTVAEIEANSDDNVTSKFYLKCSHFTMVQIYGYNGTTFNSFTHAWNNWGLYSFWGVDFEHVSTSYNAFDLVGKLLFWQLPSVNVYINALISIPMWICIEYLLFIFILRVIGAVFGGGGA